MEKVQRLILINQYRILAQQEPELADEHNKAVKALQSGYEWQINQLVEDSTYGWLPEDECRFVSRVLDMYEHIEDSIQGLAEPTKAEVSKLPWLRFRGFDGNNEGEYMGYARYLVQDEGRWAYMYFASCDMNSHMPTLPAVRRMLELHNSFERGDALSAEDLRQLSEAGRGGFAR